MISNKFAALLGDRLVKITKVSQDTGISRTTLTNLYYRKSTKISFDVLNKLCEYLDCAVEDIIEFRVNSEKVVASEDGEGVNE